MAYSGSADFTLNRDAIIRKALNKIGVLAKGETPDAEDIFDGAQSLNLMLKAWQNEGMGLWLNQQVTLYLQKDQQSYLLGPGGAHCTASPVETTVHASYPASEDADYLYVTSTSGIAHGDYVGIELDDGTLQWDMAYMPANDRDGVCESQARVFAGSLVINGDLTTGGVARCGQPRLITVYSANDNRGQIFTITGTDYTGAALTDTITGPNAGETVSGTKYFGTVTAVSTNAGCSGFVEVGVGDVNIVLAAIILPIAGTLDDDAAAGNAVFSYTDKIRRPLDIIEARYCTSENHERPLTPMDAAAYKWLTIKSTSGQALQYYYDPQLTNSVLYVWPVCDDVSARIKMTVKTPVDDLDQITDNAQFPVEWLEAIIYNLALRLAPEYGVVPMPEVKEMAIVSKAAAVGFDRGTLPVQFIPAVEW